MNLLKAPRKCAAAVLITLIVAPAVQAQDVCDGGDAVGGSITDIHEAGARVFATSTGISGLPYDHGLFISCDGGDSWYRHPAFTRGALAATSDAADSDAVYVAAGGGHLMASRDAGTTWVEVDPVPFDNNNISALTSRMGGHIIAGFESGAIYQSLDYGMTWDLVTTELPFARIYELLADPTNTNRLLVAVGDAGIYQSNDTGQTFSQGTLAGLLLPPSFWPVRAMSFAPGNASNVVAGGSAGLFESVDGGTVFARMADVADVVDLKFDRAGAMLVVGQRSGLARSDDAGQTFTDLSGDSFGASTRFTQALELESGRLLLGTAVDGLYKSDNNGASWQFAGTEPQSPLPPPPPAPVTANLIVDVESLNGGERIEYTSKARFRVTIRNNGPDVSTDTYVRLEWTHPSQSGGRSSKNLELTGSGATCTVGPNVETGCRFGNVRSGQTVSINVTAGLSSDYIGTHSLMATASNDQGAVSSDNASVASKKTIACYGDCDDSEGGGGSFDAILGLSLLGLLFLRLVVGWTSAARAQRR